MKKILKPLIIIFVILGLIAGGLYFWYNYNNSKKIAKVVSMESYGMDGFWGDNIESYGEVTSDKAQMAYIASGTEITGVNVAVGDHVNEGDVLMTVLKESQNIRGKELEVQKAQQKLFATINTLERYKNTKPIPEYIATQEDTRTLVDEKGDEYEAVVGMWYYDAETGQVIGHTSTNPDAMQYPPPEGYKPSELKEKIEEITKDVEKADLDYRIKAFQLDVMKNTDDSGQIKAKVSGTVSKVQSKENYNTTQPFIVVTATDEYYITGSIGEFYLDSVHVGDTVSITSWDTGNYADAVITSISDSPSKNDNFWGGSGNTNSSNYEFKASFDKNSGIEIGSAVNISITPSDQETGGFYISNEFIRKDSSGSFVMKMNSNNQLEKVYIRIGKSLWGSMTEVKEGVGKEDYLAFPYGNGAIEGINCEIADSLN